MKPHLLYLFSFMSITIQECTNPLRLAAWLGDSAHHLDVRMGLLLSSIECVELQRTEETYTSNAAQAIYWKSVPTDHLVWQPVGTSDHSLGTAFEANYHAEFRHDYLKIKFPRFYQVIEESWTPPEFNWTSNRKAPVLNTGINLTELGFIIPNLRVAMAYFRA